MSISAFGLFTSLRRLLLIGGALRLLIGQSAVSFLLAGYIVFFPRRVVTFGRNAFAGSLTCRFKAQDV